MSARPGMASAWRAAAVAALVAAPGALASAQQSSASVTAYGMAGSYTALARGYDAVAWNPANLGLPGNPAFSLSLLAAGGTSGVDPVSLADIKQYQGVTLPASVKQEWLERVTANGGETGQGNAGVSYLALSAGRVALQVSSNASLGAKMTPDAFEALLYGNAGRTGTPRDLDFSGSQFDGSAFTTAAASVGIPLGAHLALGVTGKYVLGNFVEHAADAGSSVTSSGVAVSFPVVYSPPDSGQVVGSGAGVDVGAAWTGERLTWSATVRNVFNSFAWNEAKLVTKEGSATFDGTTNATSFDDQPFASAPQSLRYEVASDRFEPAAAVGVAYLLSPSLTIAGDAHRALRDGGIQLDAPTQVSGGVEYRGIPLLPLRIGAAYVTDGWAASAGVGLHLGPYELGVAGMVRERDGMRETGAMVGLVSVR